MAKIRLNAQYQNGQAYIRLVYRYRIGAKQIKFMYSTGRQVAADQWNQNGRKYAARRASEYQAINTALAGLVSHAEKVVNDYQGRPYLGVNTAPAAHGIGCLLAGRNHAG